MTGKRTFDKIQREDKTKRKKINTSSEVDKDAEEGEDVLNEEIKEYISDSTNGNANKVSSDKNIEMEKANVNEEYDRLVRELKKSEEFCSAAKNDEEHIDPPKEITKELEEMPTDIVKGRQCLDKEKMDEKVKTNSENQNVEKKNSDKVDTSKNDMKEVKDLMTKNETDTNNKNKDTLSNKIDTEKENVTRKVDEKGIYTEKEEGIKKEARNDTKAEEEREKQKEGENETKTKEESEKQKKGENETKTEEESEKQEKGENETKTEEESEKQKKGENETKTEEESEKQKKGDQEDKKETKHESERGDEHEAKKKRSEQKKKEDVKSKKREKGESQALETKKNENTLSINDAVKEQCVHSAINGENKMLIGTMDSNYANYSTNYLEQHYNTTNCYSDMSKSSVYNAYHNHSNNSNNTIVATSAAINNMNNNMNELKKNKKHGYSSKTNCEAEYKVDDKNGIYTKMPNMYLNNNMNQSPSGQMHSHMIGQMTGNIGTHMSGSHMSYPAAPITPLPNSVPVSVPMAGTTPNMTSSDPISNNPLENYYMYNYNYMNNPNCNSYYYMYDNKGYDYQRKESESEKVYDFSAVIDKSLEIMKRNNKVKEILKHPARLQITPEELNKYEYTEGNDNYNIWFGKYVTDRFDKSAKNIPRFVAKYKCNPQKDSGYTKADRMYNSKQFFCIYFARGCCAYGSNCLYRHRVPTENDELEFEHTVDIFGREKFSTYKDDMSGVGCFNSDCRTLFIGSVFINNFNEAPKVEKMLYDEFAKFGNVDYVRFIPNKNIAFVQYSNRVNAEFAKVAMSDQPLENHSTALTIKWAYEFKHPPSNYGHYYNTPYVYNQNQVISPTWGNYLMQQQYAGNNGSSFLAGNYMNGHPSSYLNNNSMPAAYPDYTNMYSAQYNKIIDRCNNINNSLNRIDQMFEPQGGRKGGAQ